MSAGENPFAGLQGLGGAADEGAAADPMAQMLRMMLASGGGGSGGPMPGAGPMPGKPGMPEQSAATAASAITAESLWRILHAILALTLGLFAAFQGDLRLPFLSSSYDDALVPRRGLFAGTKDERDRAAALAAVSSPELSAAAIRDAAKQFFWLFATAEALLLTTRFFLLERFGKAGASAGSHGGGILAIVADVLPEPLGGYARTLLKYWRIAGTVMADLMVCVFVLGVCVWLGR